MTQNDFTVGRREPSGLNTYVEVDASQLKRFDCTALEPACRCGSTRGVLTLQHELRCRRCGRAV